MHECPSSLVFRGMTLANEFFADSLLFPCQDSVELRPAVHGAHPTATPIPFPLHSPHSPASVSEDLLPVQFLCHQAYIDQYTNQNRVVKQLAWVAQDSGCLAPVWAAEAQYHRLIKQHTSGGGKSTTKPQHMQSPVRARYPPEGSS